MRRRYLEGRIKEDLNRKMVFVVGPRRVGKTTLSLNLARKHFKKFDYLNWDHPQDRKRIINLTFKGEAKLIIFDEIHKYRWWKNLIKGFYDREKDKYKILVTGSARLDVYRRGGDSMMGRYYLYRLHPFSVAEVIGAPSKLVPFEEIDFPEVRRKTKEAFKSLFKFGGFPEPFLAQSEREHRRWLIQRMDTLVREEIRDLEAVRDISLIQVLVDILPDRASSRLSINSLREDLNLSHKAVSHYVDILERFYYCFRVFPFSARKVRSLKKEPKLYLWDWSSISSEGARLENMVACHLLKLCHYLQDSEGYRTELYYLRDVAGREVDFLVAVNSQPWFAVEVKSSYKEVSRHILYFKERINIPFSYQVVNERDVDIYQDGVRIMSVEKFLSALI